MSKTQFDSISSQELDVACGGVQINMNQLSASERYIVQNESGGRTNAQNPTSTAFGIGQLTIANRRHYLGANANTQDPGLQLQAFRGYVHDRYGTADRAASFWRSHHWY
ncbi:MAG TPA: hypothetical protein VGM39_24855 [Kofleriaceae bacterium]|jgi:hypothetical protein